MKSSPPQSVLEDINGLRRKLSSDPSIIQKTDFGTGGGGPIQVKEMYRRGSCSSSLGEILFKLQLRLDGRVLELGTQLGLATSYLCLGTRQGKVTSIEGCPETAKIAHAHLSRFQDRFQPVVGDINAHLNDLAENRYELIYFDANHSKEATLAYAKQFMKTRTNDSIWVFDDIHWSTGMTEAWNEIKAMKEVKISMDFGRFGILTFQSQVQKQDYLLRP